MEEVEVVQVESLQERPGYIVCTSYSVGTAENPPFIID